mmetsp:Transcript_14466/g.34872  ORF Transcript_14466/g.34872 Transcript_14466/m.34872 type:complete len:205 (-) Transcript_14466:197-811(-)
MVAPPTLLRKSPADPSVMLTYAVMIPTLAATTNVLSDEILNGPNKKYEVNRVKKAPLMAAPCILTDGTFLAMVGSSKGVRNSELNFSTAVGSSGTLGTGGTGGSGVTGGSSGGVGLTGHDFSSVVSSSSSSSAPAKNGSSSFSLMALSLLRNLEERNEAMGSIHCWVIRLLLLDLLPNKLPLPAATPSLLLLGVPPPPPTMPRA